jgi:hypothetical protein
MNRVTITTTLVLTLAGMSLLSAAGAQAPAPDPKIGTTVTITGCLHKGTSRNSFVLVGVTERADTPEKTWLVPYAIYWLDSTDGLKDLVGEMVDVTGKVTERRKNPGTIKISIDPDEALTTDVQVSSASKTLDVTTEKYDEKKQTPVATSGESSSIEVSRPVYKLAVENVHSVGYVPTAGPACR